ncbi:unnamed protein product [Lactuca saligna]|uniref:Secreted protein n=1 Tax=Lactuca saligna TaxID=75948 RepID=A0AA36E041_LACSI|nr:unnamed protein product [Lactuca saligna]
MHVCLHLPFAIALYLSSMALGCTPSSRICGGHWFTWLALSYEGGRGVVEDSEDDIVEPIQKVKLEDIVMLAFMRHQRPSYVEPSQPKMTLRCCIGGALLDYGFSLFGGMTSGVGPSTFS